jgi:ribonuclease PH
LTAEGETFDEEGLLRLLRLARIGCAEIFAAQDAAVRGATGR